MINRSRKKTQYVFNSKTGNLEKLNNIKDIQDAANEQEEIKPITSIALITSEDNLIHNYFTVYETSWDASNVLQIVTLKMPKLNAENVNYWATYTGQVTIYMGSGFTYDYVNGTGHTNEQEVAESLIKYWDNSNIKPFFRGEVDHIRERHTELVVYIKNIGSRFQQKIPEDFRQQYIYNQNVRDSFQAICEFLGVPYICPPKTVVDAAGEETTENNSSGDGNENDVGSQVGSETQLANTAKNIVKNASNQLYNKDKNTIANKSNNDENTDENTEVTNENGNISDNVVNDIINGYDDISFDANGAIVHGSTLIETSPDMAHTLVAMEEHPFEKYLDDETGIIEKVNNFLNGEIFEELHNNVMDYGAITIEPKSTTTSTPTTDSSPTNSQNGTSENNNNSNSQSGSSNSSAKTKSSLQARDRNGWHNGQYYINGKIYLSKEYINSLSPEQARQKRTGAYANHTYTDDTMQKLLWRSLGSTLR